MEDNQDECMAIVNYAEDIEDVKIIGVTNNSLKALEYVRDYVPDVIILDLELHVGSGNGLMVIQNLNQLDLPKRPYILVTTNNTSVVTYEMARNLGADFIMSKHQEDYSAKNIINFISMLKSTIQSRTANIGSSHSTPETPSQREKRIRKRITAEINLVGISPKRIGYDYLIAAIEILIERKEQQVSSIIARKYGKSTDSVERAMQNAILRAWQQSNPSDLLTYYTAPIRSDKGAPTLYEFIYYYANKIKNDY